MLMMMKMKMMRMIIMMTIDRHYCGKDKDDHGDGDVTDGDPDHDGDQKDDGNRDNEVNYDQLCRCTRR